MDKKGSQRRQKRQSKAIEENFWDCSVCTFRNTAEAFKCAMCDVRKGTSTRKPRLNPQLVAQQAAQHLTVTSSTITKPQTQKREESKERKTPQATLTPTEEKHPKKKIRNIRPRLMNVDRTSFNRQSVTVNNVTVVITEFYPKPTPNTSSSPNPIQSNEKSTHITNNSEINTTGEHIQHNTTLPT